MVAKEVSGLIVPASGSIPTFKGDVRSSIFLIECKTTDKDYYILTSKVWEKIFNEALKDGLREPIMQIDIERGNKRFAVVLKYSFEPYVNIDDFINIDVCKNSFRVKEEAIINWSTARAKLLIIDWNKFLDLSKQYEKDVMK